MGGKGSGNGVASWSMEVLLCPIRGKIGSLRVRVASESGR